MKRLLVVLAMVMGLYGNADAANKFFGATGLIGGTAGKLDAIDGDQLSDGDGAQVVTATDVYFYSLDADSAAAESSPDVISPDDNAGNKRWLLVDVVSGTISPTGLTATYLPYMTASGLDDSAITYDGTDNIVVQMGTDSTTAVQILDADGGTPVVSVDTTNERVGIGTDAPTVNLDVAQAATVEVNVDNTTGPTIQLRSGATQAQIGSITDHPVILEANNVEVIRLENGTGNLGIGQTTFGTSAAKNLAIGNGTAPTTSPADAIQMWSADTNGTAGKAGLHIRTEDGTTHVFGDKVGIGTASPAYNLEVIGSGLFSDQLTISSDILFGADATDYKAGSYPELFATTNTGGSYPFLSNGNFIIQGRSGSTVGDIVLATGNTASPRLNVTFGGNVGIGTTSPATLLDVDGQIAQDGEIVANKSSVNTKMPSQAVELTAAASGSTGIVVADNDNIDFGTGDFTLVWRGSLPDWTPTDEPRLFRKRDGTLGVEVYPETGSTGKLSVFIADASGYTVVLSSIANTFIDNTAHELTFVFDRANGLLYIYADGNQFGAAVDISARPATWDTTTALYISGKSDKRTASRTEAAYTFNRALTAAEVADLYKNGVSYADKYGSQTEQTSGTLTAGKRYRINDWITADDFTNVGGTNEDGNEFIAAGAGCSAGVCTPTTWTNSSTVVPAGATLALEPESIQSDKWYDSANGLDASYPAAGASLVRPADDVVPGNFTINGGQTAGITTVNAATYDLLTTDYILNVTYTATGAVTSLTLPTAQCTSGRIIIVKDAGGGAAGNNITVDTEGAETIDGAATAVITTNYSSINLYSDGSNWFVY